MDHPNIVKFYEVYEDNKYIHLVMEHCSGGDLYEMLLHIEKFDEDQVKEIILPIIKAVNYLHNCGICHRDLKLENILFKDNQSREPKMIDFGLSTDF